MKKSNFSGRILGEIPLLLMLVANHPATAEDAASADGVRPKIGLALSGGGARGAAHIGVIRVLEEHNVPIDYIAGTSMGAVVGGLYSSGMDTYEIETALAAIDWDHVFNDRPPRADRSFRRKRDDDLYLVKAKPGFNDGKLTLPLGAVQGQKIDAELARVALPVATVESFDELMIPFRAVASDIATGEAAVLSSGDLAMAIRASMSIPAVISPAEIDGRLLVDGGVANNLPIDVVRDMGADIVIAVDISTPLVGQEELTSVLRITQQLTGILTRRNTEEQISTLRDGDIFLVPDLGDIATADFSRLAEAIPIGRTAAMAEIERLRQLSLTEVEYQAYQASLPDPRSGLPVIDRIRLENNSRLSDRYLSSRLVETETGEPLNVAGLERDMGRIFGLELFQNVRYDLTEENEETVLDIRVDERSWGPNYLQFGLEYNSNGEGENLFNLGMTYLQTALNTRGAEWRTGFQIGSEPALFSELHQPFGPKFMYFVNPGLFYSQDIFNVLEGSEVVASFKVKQGGAVLGVGRELGSWGEARIGIRYADGESERRVGDTSLPDLAFQRGEVFARFSLDEFDDFNFPRHGARVLLEWSGSRTGLGADDKFDQLNFSAAIARTRNRNTLVLGGEYNATISGTAPLQSLNRLGSFTRLSGFTQNELRGQNSALAVAVFYRQLNQSVALPIFAGASLEQGNVWERRSDISFSNSITAGSVFLGLESIVGPLYLAYGRSEGGSDQYYFFFGRPF